MKITPNSIPYFPAHMDADTQHFQRRNTQIFVSLNMHPINRPDVIVTFASEKIDENGRVTDEATRKFIREMLESLVAWTRRLKRE